LVILRGNSGSGKTSAAREVQRRYGRGCALVEQDHLRRVVLQEHGGGRIPTVAPAFIVSVVRAALEHGYHVVLEGILHTGQYGELLRELVAEQPGPTSVFWLEVSFSETVRRHNGRSEAIPVTAEQMGLVLPARSARRARGADHRGVLGPRADRGDHSACQ
jgi:predicted kinase